MKAKDQVSWDLVDYGPAVFHVVSYGRAESPAAAKAVEPKAAPPSVELPSLWRRLCGCAQPA